MSLNRWEKVRELGEGGQGKVWLVRDTEAYTHKPLQQHFINALSDLGGIKYGNDPRRQAFEKLRQCIIDMVNSESPAHQGALKVLHPSDKARDADRATERIRREIRAMSETTHRNLLGILDSSPEEGWFVSQYHPNGVLHDKLDRFQGNLPDALAAFRPLVAAVANLHANNIVHRDIKPANVFLASDDTLILGDLGLAYFTDDEHTRLSATLDNVGSRDWMPPWQTGPRIEDIPRSCDVYSLGKVLWAMVSGKPNLQFWWFDREKNNVERQFPGSPHIEFANQIFKRCIVEEETDCLPDAMALLEKVDGLLRRMELGADAISDRPTRTCRVCGMGEYSLVVDRDKRNMANFFGSMNFGTIYFKIFACSHCRHVQMFSFDEGKTPPAWPSSTS